MEHENELIEIKDRQRKMNDVSKKERNCSREGETKAKSPGGTQTPTIFFGAIPNQNKKYRMELSTTFCSFQKTPYLSSPFEFSTAPPTSTYQLSDHAQGQNRFCTQGGNGNNGTIDLTNFHLSEAVRMVPNFTSLLNSLDDDNNTRGKKVNESMREPHGTRSAL